MPYLERKVRGLLSVPHGIPHTVAGLASPCKACMLFCIIVQEPCCVMCIGGYARQERAERVQTVHNDKM